MFKVFLAYLPYAIITTFTPGPNNIMSLYAVSHAGWSKGRQLISGILAGFSLVTVLSIIFCHELAIYIPELIDYLKYIGAIYILWLAVHIAHSTPGTEQERSINFMSGFLLCVSNVKVILFLLTIFTVYIVPAGVSLSEMFIHGAIIILISLVDWCTWGTAGRIMQKFLVKYYRPFNILMGILLAWCAVQILL